MIGRLCCVVGLHSWAWRLRYFAGAFGHVAVCRRCDAEWRQTPMLASLFRVALSVVFAAVFVSILVFAAYTGS